MSTAGAAAQARAATTTAAATATANLPFLVGALVVGLLLYYFIGIDEGATSVFGNSMVIHELVHDSRHFLGFPCH